MESDARGDRLWVYAVLPAVILNAAGCIIFGAYYGLAAQQPEWVAGIGQGGSSAETRKNRRLLRMTWPNRSTQVQSVR